MKHRGLPHCLYHVLFKPSCFTRFICKRPAGICVLGPARCKVLEQRSPAQSLLANRAKCIEDLREAWKGLQVQPLGTCEDQSPGGLRGTPTRIGIRRPRLNVDKAGSAWLMGSGSQLNSGRERAKGFALASHLDMWPWDNTNGTILVYFSGNWDVHWGLTGLLTHSHV